MLKHNPSKPKTEKREKTELLWHFLEGSKRFFALSILSAAITALADMIQPQIIRAAVDNAIGGKPSTFSAPVMRLVDAAGGFAYLGKHLWIMGLAMLLLSVVGGAFQFLRGKWMAEASESIAKTMRDKLYRHLQTLPFDYHVKAETGLSLIHI